MPGTRFGPYGRHIKPAAQLGAGVGLPFGGLFTGCVTRCKASTFDSANTRLTDLTGLGNHLAFASATDSPKHLEYSGTKSVYLPGVAGNYLSAADSAALSVTGNLELQFGGAPDSVAPSAEQVLVGKWNTGALSYYVSILSSGLLRFRASSTGAVAAVTADSTATLASAGFTAGGDLHVVVTFAVHAVATTIEFYTSPTGAGGSYTKLGATVSGGACAAIADTAAPLEVGSNLAGTAGNFAGRVYYAKVLNGIGGSVVFNAQTTNASATSGTFAESSVNAATVTINYAAAAGRTSWVLDESVVVFGLDDYAQIPDSDLLDFGAGQSFTVTMRLRITRNPAAQTAPWSKKASFAAASTGYGLSLTTARLPQGQVSDGTNQIAPSAGNLVAGTTARVTVVRDAAADTVTVYKDSTAGTPVTDTTTGSSANGFALRVGRHADTGTAFFDGGVYDFAVWRRALSATEVASLATAM